VGFHLVEKSTARRHRPKADSAVGAGQDQLTAREPLRKHRVAAFARPRRHDQRAKLWALVDQRLDALLRQPFR
jgi:hypothetical protein